MLQSRDVARVCGGGDRRSKQLSSAVVGSAARLLPVTVPPVAQTMLAITDTSPERRTDTVPALTAARSAQRLLAVAARTWFAVALVGQLIFSAYIAVLYGGATVTGDMARFNSVMPRGYVPGDTAGNAAIVSHVLLAVVIMIAGAMQLMPAIRRRVPALHRWVGRGYVIAVSLTSLAGLYMVWWRGSAGDTWQHVAISLNAVILTTCALLAWRMARVRDFATHRQWALRAYLAANGVFFFRLGVFLWIVINQGPVGFDPETFRGPFLTTLAFAVYVIVPLSILQLYFVAQRSSGVWLPRFTALGLFTLALLSAGGIGSVSMILWLPAMR